MSKDEEKNFEEGEGIVEEPREKKQRGELIPGTILIILGLLFLLPKLGINFGNLWPMFILAPGISFFVFYLFSNDRQKIRGVLIPAVITTSIAVLFFVLNFTSWEFLEKLWPFFPIFVALAFYVTYFSGQKDRGLLVAANILSVTGLVFLSINIFSVNLWPLILILVGLYIILFPRRK
jgi:hypothetical protein